MLDDLAINSQILRTFPKNSRKGWIYQNPSKILISDILMVMWLPWIPYDVWIIAVDPQTKRLYVCGLDGNTIP